jgi:hypothetical protein
MHAGAQDVMDAVQIGVTIGGVLVIGAILVFFFGTGRSR